MEGVCICVCIVEREIGDRQIVSWCWIKASREGEGEGEREREREREREGGRERAGRVEER